MAPPGTIDSLTWAVSAGSKVGDLIAKFSLNGLEFSGPNKGNSRFATKPIMTPKCNDPSYAPKLFAAIENVFDKMTSPDEKALLRMAYPSSKQTLAYTTHNDQITKLSNAIEVRLIEYIKHSKISYASNWNESTYTSTPKEGFEVAYKAAMKRSQQKGGVEAARVFFMALTAGNYSETKTAAAAAAAASVSAGTKSGSKRQRQPSQPTPAPVYSSAHAVYGTQTLAGAVSAADAAAQDGAGATKKKAATWGIFGM